MWTDGCDSEAVASGAAAGAATVAAAVAGRGSVDWAG